MGPIISLDEWIPERPPKNPLLRVPSPEFLPPPPPSPHATSNPDNQDPLPPPPPELLRHMRQKSEPDNKFNTPSRRNSFAGSSSSTRKPFIRVSKFENLSPPLLPRKPNSIELFNARPFSSMRQSHAGSFQTKPANSAAAAAQQAHKSNQIGMNGRLDQKINGTAAPNTPTISINRSSPSSIDSRVSIRKRTHNAPMSLASPDENRNR